MRTRLLTFGVWLVVAASALFWGLKVLVPRPAMPAQAQLPARHVALGGELRRLLGVSAAPADDEEEASDEGSDRFQLLGVVAPRGAGTSPQGVALISVGGQPARPWRTGAVVDGDTVLLSVDRRSVQLGPRGGPPSTELTLPEPTRNNPSPNVAPLVNGQQGVRPQLPGVPGPNQLRPMGVQPMGVQPPAQHPQAVQPKQANQAGNNNAADDEEEE